MNKPSWLLFFYTMPTKPVGGRTKIWRKLTKIGTIKLRGSVHVLPYSDEHLELLQWLISELPSLGGEGAYVEADAIEPLTTNEIINLFNEQCASRYDKLDSGLKDLEKAVKGLEQTNTPERREKVSSHLQRQHRELRTVAKTDFFHCETGKRLDNRLTTLRIRVDRFREQAEIRQPGGNIKNLAKERKNYQARQWITRKKPFVDRMASAWLIRRFIDQQAVFSFIDDSDLEQVDQDALSFDIRKGNFTHCDNLCTFETLIRSFDLRDPALDHIARIVHDLDLHDNKFGSMESEGVEMILSGIRKTAESDSQALEQGMEIFEAMYTAIAD